MNIPEIKISPVEESEIEIIGELPVVDFVVYREKALAALNKNISIDGFRPGHAPEKVIIEQVGEDKILWEMAEQAVTDLYGAILEEKKIMAMGRPEITITKLAKDNPLGFKIKTAIMPEMTVVDYKAIAKKTNSEPVEVIEANNVEVDKVIEELRKSRATESHAHSATSKHPAECGHEHKEGEKCEHEHNNPAGELPELNDDFAKSLGNFQTLDELKAKVKENLELEKKAKAQDKKRVAIVQEIIKESTIKIPKLLIEAEKDKMLAEMESQIGYMGLKFDDYLIHLKKTKEELRGAWDKEARERVAFGLVLNEIAKQEKITPPEEDLKREVDYLKNQYKDVAEDRLRSYAAGLIINEKVFEYLESIK